MGNYTKDTVRKLLESPGKDSRGYTRWWWYGCAVDKEEIMRELNEMQAAEIGGVELQILYPLQADDREKGIKNEFYLSPGFFESIRFACAEAKKRGMVFDMTLGSSWPFGGPFIPKSLSAPNVIPYTIDVHGPCEFSYDFTTRVYGECVGCVMGRMQDSQMEPDSIIDLTGRVVDKYLFQWEWGKELQNIRIPEGDYKIVIFISNDKRQTVLKPLPGGEGLIIDHDRKDSLRCFLEHGGKPVADYMGPGMIQSFFCDSLEVFGQNWTDIIYDEFYKRRGYNLRPYIYALWGEIRGCTEFIRYDFHKTLAELTEENFFCELTKWCHENGALSRIQAHGTWGDILRCYGAADIPEGETFSEYDRYEVNTIHRRLASSAGHVYHKKIISNESFTWLTFPRFLVTLERMKAAADSIYLDGMNHIVNHGYAYSLREEGVKAAGIQGGDIRRGCTQEDVIEEVSIKGNGPWGLNTLGTPFYASSQINDKNTWWPYYKELGTYINRVSDWLRRGKPVAKAAIYLPQADIWAENPMSDIHMCMKLEERLTTEMADSIQKAGYWFDYVNDDIVCRMQEYGYEALLLIECERIPVETARGIRRYAQAGGVLISNRSFPEKACGFMHYVSDTEEVQRIFKGLEKNQRCRVTGRAPNEVIRELHRFLEPDVKIVRRPDVIGYVHRAEEGEDIYFIANVSPEWITEEVIFSGQQKNFTAFDPLSAREKPVLHVRQDGETRRVTVRFEPYQSLLFVFSDGIDDIYIEEEHRRLDLKDISEGWKLEVKERRFEKSYAILQSWEKEGALEYFSGEGVYTREITISQKEWELLKPSFGLLLAFAHIGETADIYVNGQRAGVLFKRPYQLDIKDFLRRGNNTIEVRVRNLLINRAIDPAYPEVDYPEPVIGEWPYSTGKLNQNRHEFLYCHRERKMVKEPLPSGIWGDIRLILVSY